MCEEGGWVSFGEVCVCAGGGGGESCVRRGVGLGKLCSNFYL